MFLDHSSNSLVEYFCYLKTNRQQITRDSAHVLVDLHLINGKALQWQNVEAFQREERLNFD